MASWLTLVEHGQALGPDPELAGLDDDDLVEQVRLRAVAISAATARWVVAVAELVVRGVWAQQGARTPGQWLSWAVGMAPTTARDHVRVGLALRTLPKIRAAFLAGEVSYSKVRAMTRLGHAQTEDVLLQWADAAPAAELERIVTATRRSCRVDGVEADPFAADPTDASQEAARVERYDWVAHDDGAEELRLRMDPADAARIQAGLRWLARTNDDDIPFAAKVVAALDDAVSAAMEHAPEDQSGLDRDRLVVDATIVEAPPSGCRDASAAPGDSAEASSALRLVPRLGPTKVMSVQTLQRLACTAWIVPVPMDVDGTPLDVGRSQRRATAKQRRALRVREPVCGFPGCSARRHLHAHHAVEWDDGGTTDLDNLIQLCAFHHRFVHRSGWRVVPLGAGRFRILDALGRQVDDKGPARLRPAASAEARSTGWPPPLGVAPDDPNALQPAYWDGGSVDHDLCVLVLRQELDRRSASQPPEPGSVRVAA